MAAEAKARRIDQLAECRAVRGRGHANDVGHHLDDLAISKHQLVVGNRLADVIRHCSCGVWRGSIKKRDEFIASVPKEDVSNS